MSKLGKLIDDPFLFLADTPLMRMSQMEFLQQRLRSLSGRPKTAKAKRGLIRLATDFVHFGNARVGAEIGVYFYGDLDRFYQLEQWLRPLEALNEHHPVVLIVRSYPVWTAVQGSTSLPVVFCHSLKQVMSFYDDAELKCILYVNHGYKNFQSLIDHRSLHVHINHGESEKSSMYSNQSKAYDYVLVAGDAGKERYRRHLMKFDPEKYIPIGRPQLDFVDPKPRFAPPEVTTVLYAPTWAATHESMDYSSVAYLGRRIADAFLDREGYFFVYRPHPNCGRYSLGEREADEYIRERVASASNAIQFDDPAILGVFSAVDIAIFDNSSVAIDYLTVDKPMLMTDRFGKQPKPTVVGACTLLSVHEKRPMNAVVDDVLDNDKLSSERLRLRRHYFGDLGPGESVTLFVETLGGLVKERDRLRSQLTARRSSRHEPGDTKPSKPRFERA